MNYRIKESFLSGVATIIGLEVGIKTIKGVKLATQIVKNHLVKKDDCFEDEE